MYVYMCTCMYVYVCIQTMIVDDDTYVRMWNLLPLLENSTVDYPLYIRHPEGYGGAGHIFNRAALTLLRVCCMFPDIHTYMDGCLCVFAVLFAAVVYVYLYMYAYCMSI